MNAEEESRRRVEALERTEAWLRHAVIDLGLCPFARDPFEAGRVRLTVCEAREPEALLAALEEELLRLRSADPSGLETSLLICPFALASFEEFLSFLDLADWLLGSLGMRGELQIASFHPDYRFEGEAEGDPSHFTNRSPYPLLHLLREASLTEATEAHPDPGAIPRRNVRLMRRIAAADPEALPRLRRGEPAAPPGREARAEEGSEPPAR